MFCVHRLTTKKIRLPRAQCLDSNSLSCDDCSCKRGGCCGSDGYTDFESDSSARCADACRDVCGQLGRALCGGSRQVRPSRSEASGLYGDRYRPYGYGYQGYNYGSY